jgi:hypothetical protein
MEAEIEKWTSGLAGALKEVAKLASESDWILIKMYDKVPYLKALKGHIATFQTNESNSRTSVYNWLKKMARSFSLHRPNADSLPNLIELFKELRKTHEDLLKQIWLEATLHYTFKSLDLIELEETAENLIYHKYEAPMKLNNAVKYVHINLAAVLKSTLKNKNEQNFVSSLSEVAQKAPQLAEGSKSC